MRLWFATLGGAGEWTDSAYWRRRLAQRAKALGRRLLAELDTLVTPDTLLRRHRQLIAQKWNYSRRRGVGRPRTKADIAALILRIAGENPTWGYTRIQGTLKNLGLEVSRGTVANVLRENGIDPAPQRGKRMSWSTFLEAHWKVLVASHFLTVEVWRLRGLTTCYVLFFIELKTRVVSIVGVTTYPDERWMLQAGRNVLDDEAGVGSCARVVLLDRDTKYCAEFRQLLSDAGHSIFRLPPRSPNLNLNAYA